MIRQQAFSDKGVKMLKGGLHCHTTRSDGAVAPDEVIRLHARNGYDFLAITDHRRYNFENFAPETSMTIVPGMEFDDTFERGRGFRCWHTVCLGPEKGNPYVQDQTFESGTAHTQEEYQGYLDKFHANGQLTILCHPEWSSTPARYFERLKGNFAMEVWNSGCAIDNDMDVDAAYWDELLGQDIRIFGVATDDGHAASQHCHGWVCVASENNVASILDALRNGRFYSSCGPEIHDFFVEDGKAFVECSPAAKVRLHSDCHPTRIVRSADANLRQAEFDLACGWPGPYKYVRIEVIDADGKYAWSNPIFLD